MTTTPASPVETTGEIVMSWGPDGPSITAPAKAVIPMTALFDLERDHAQPRVVRLPGGIRYVIGNPHRRWRNAVYLHKLA